MKNVKAFFQFLTKYATNPSGDHLGMIWGYAASNWNDLMRKFELVRNRLGGNRPSALKWRSKLRRCIV